MRKTFIEVKNAGQTETLRSPLQAMADVVDENLEQNKKGALFFCGEQLLIHFCKPYNNSTWQYFMLQTTQGAMQNSTASPV